MADGVKDGLRGETNQTDFEYGSGGRDIPINKPMYGEEEGLSVQNKIGKPGDGGPDGDMN